MKFFHPKGKRRRDFRKKKEGDAAEEGDDEECDKETYFRYN